MRVLPEEIGPYRILELLGEGSMGVVYRAAAQDGQTVALKTVLVPSGGLLQSIRREIHALARLRHPGIVRILGEGLWQGVPWYAMELLEGATLRQHCSQRPELLSALTLVRRLCAPLAYLHGEGIVHRDLKPDNVFLRPDTTPVLVDFGLVSRFGSELSRELLETGGAVSGTAAYMAPEQGRGEFVDARTDLYALGCMLYELVTGRPPFVGQVPAQVLWQHFQAEPIPPSRLVEGLPPDLDALILRLLAKRPRERLGHADDVAAALVALGAEAAEAETGPRPRAYLYRPGFTGREAPLRALSARFPGSGAQDASAEAGGMTMIGGESGVGKTRLVMELAARAKRLRATVIVGECQPLAAGAAGGSRGGPPLHPLRGALQAVADRCREKGPEETARLLGRRGPVLADFEPSLLGLPGQEAHPRPADLPPAAALLRLYNDLTETLAVLAAAEARPAESRAQPAAPLLLILDDLQWADDLTLGWLAHLIRGRCLESMPMFLVGTYRTEELGEGLRPVLEALAVEPLLLGRLDQTAIGSIVGDMLALDPPPAVFVRFLTRQSEGNPFFVAEYLRAAVAEGVLHRDGAGQWQVSAEQQTEATEELYEALPLPHSLRELARRRFEGLSALARHLADAAAVLGREMDEALLAEVSRFDSIEMMDAAHELIARQVLEEPSTGRLRFAHDKLRETTYEAIEEPRRRELHRAAAKATGMRPGSERSETLAVMGHHWEQAGEPDRARDCYLPAARDAKKRHIFGEAERLYRAYLRLSKVPALETVEARDELGYGILTVRGSTSEAGLLLRQALTEARELGNRLAEARLLRRLGVVLHQDSTRSEEVWPYFEAALAIARQIPDRLEEGQNLLQLGIAHATRGRPAEAWIHFQEVLGIVQEVKDPSFESGALSIVAILHRQQGRLAESRALLQQALRLDREMGNRIAEASHIGALAQTYADEGGLEAAQDLYEQALAVHRETGNRSMEGQVLGNLGINALVQGRMAEARRVCEQAVRLLREVGNQIAEGSVIHALARICVHEGRVGEARALHEQALAIHRKAGDRRFEAFGLLSLATLERRTGTIAEAERLLNRSEQIFRDVGDKLFLAHCLCAQGHVALSLGRPAASFLDQSRQIAEDLHASAAGDLGQTIGRLLRSVEAQRAGRPLFRGECLEELPEGLRRWLADAGQL